MDKQAAYVQLIRNTYPDLAIEKVSFNDRGQYNDILIINDDLIFRFPRYTEAVQQLEIETIILKGLQPYVTLPVPDPIYKSQGTQKVGEVFVGYHMIHGEPLWRETLLAINDEATIQALAIQLGTFLKTLHSVPIKSVFDVELPVVGSYAEWSDMYVRIRQKLFPYMRPEARRSVENHFEQFLNNASNFAFHPVLIHGDFGSSNILFNAKMQRLSGVPGFTQAHLHCKMRYSASKTTIGKHLRAAWSLTYNEITPARSLSLPKVCCQPSSLVQVADSLLAVPHTARSPFHTDDRSMRRHKVLTM